MRASCGSRRRPTSTTPTDSGTDNVYEITIQGSDETLSGQLEVEVTVSDVNEAPFFTDGSVAYSYAENATTVVGLFGAQDDDPDDTVTLTLAGTDATAFSLAANGEVSFVSSPDFESPADANRDNRYQLTVEASDGTNTTSQDVTVTVANVNEVPVADGPRYGHRRRELDRSGRVRHQRPGRHPPQGGSPRSRREPVCTLGQRDQLHHSAQL